VLLIHYDQISLVSIQKAVDGNAKMHIISKNVHKKLWNFSIEADIFFLSNKKTKKKHVNYDGNMFSETQQKTHSTLRRQWMRLNNWTNQWTCITISLHSISNVGLAILKCWSQSLSSKMIWYLYNDLPELSHWIAFPNTRHLPLNTK